MPSNPTQSLRQSVLVNAPADEVFDALLDAATLSRVFGRPVNSSAARGGDFSFFGRIHGTNTELERGRRIVQTFRYALPEWPLERFSKVTIQLRPVPDGTRVVLDQSGIPAPCAQAVLEHWHDHVWPGLKSILENRVRSVRTTKLPRLAVRRKIVR